MFNAQKISHLFKTPSLGCFATINMTRKKLTSKLVSTYSIDCRKDFIPSEAQIQNELEGKK